MDVYLLFKNQCCLFVDFNAQGFISKSKVVKVFTNLQDIIGVVTLNGELFVLKSENERKLEQIEVFDSETYLPKRCLTIEDLKDPSSIAACQRYNCLYVSDVELSAIHRVDLETNAASRWSVDARPSGLFVTQTSTLLVTLNSSGVIQEFTTRGEIVREVKLSHSFDLPLHAVELPSGNLVASHAGLKEHSVCIVDREERII